jgi:hypothetical protein
VIHDRFDVQRLATLTIVTALLAEAVATASGAGARSTSRVVGHALRSVTMWLDWEAA